jgi:regulator of protease activity HflC (stomatin/prohibitin superfamily)
MISETNPNGIPLMCIVQNPDCFWFKVNIPNGMYTLQQNWGVDQGVVKPGYRMCMPYWTRIQVMITKNTIRYRCPVTEIPTKDNVRISIDVGINFHIGHVQDAEAEGEQKDRQEEDCRRFFYNFGPNRLEELLTQETEEEIRAFCGQIKVARMRDIKSEITTVMLENLRKKFAPYGVVIEQISLMQVILPIDLRFALQQTTTFDVFLQRQVKQQENFMLMISNNENKKIQKLKRDNLQVLMTYQHNVDVEDIN